MIKMMSDRRLFPELPFGGPLDRYRRNAKFDYRKLAIILDGEKRLRFLVSNKLSFILMQMLFFVKKFEYSTTTNMKNREQFGSF